MEDDKKEQYHSKYEAKRARGGGLREKPKYVPNLQEIPMSFPKSVNYLKRKYHNKNRYERHKESPADEL